MNTFLLFVAIIILVCVFLNNASFKVGMPVLLAFILFGLVFGNHGLLKLEILNFGMAEKISTAALIFIMFYGGFGTRWDSAKPVVTESALLATVGVILTALLTGVFCHYAFQWDWVESLLIGSVISSTDAASVFSILRSRKLGLKNGMAPLLEMESGSNDPCSYMMTIIMLSVVNGGITAGRVVWMLFAQLGIGALLGFLIAKVAVQVLNRISFATSGFDSLFLMGVAVFAYALPSLLGGNGYLSVYIVGIIIGNHELRGKKEMVHYFDGFTGLMQVLIFFMLGLLAHPADLGRSILPAVVIFLALLILVRPVTLAVLLLPFGRKYGLRQIALLSLCGLRGAASIVFAIVAISGAGVLQLDIFNIVFCIVLLSIGLQGSLIPFAAEKLGLIDKNSNVMMTFTDFKDETDLQFSEFVIPSGHHWISKQIMDLDIPKEVLFCMIRREDGKKVVPNGHTLILEGDRIIICTKAAKSVSECIVKQETIPVGSEYVGQELRHYPVEKAQVLLVRRGEETLIPHGATVLRANDVLFINNSI